MGRTQHRGRIDTQDAASMNLGHPLGLLQITPQLRAVEDGRIGDKVKREWRYSPMQVSCIIISACLLDSLIAFLGTEIAGTYQDRHNT
jgi:hypothetical protein